MERKRNRPGNQKKPGRPDIKNQFPRIQPTNESIIVPAQHKRSTTNQPEGHGKQPPIRMRRRHSRSNRGTGKMAKKQHTQTGSQGTMDGKPRIHQRMGTPTNIQPKINDTRI